MQARAKGQAAKPKQSTVVVRRKPRTLGGLFDRWLEISASYLKPKTLVSYRRAAERITEALGTGLRLTQLRPDIIQALYGTVKAPAMRHKMHETLHRALALAVLWGWVPNNPADRVLKPKRQTQPRQVWSTDELQHFLKHASRWRPLWVLLAGSGLRIGEARALKWADIDLESGLLRVARSIQTIKGVNHIQTPKTAAGRRSVLLPPPTLAALVQWKAQQAAERARLGVDNPEDWVWTNDEGRLATYAAIRTGWVRDRRNSGLSGSIHDLRHLHATLLLAGGLPVPDAARRLGHANPTITLGIYAHAITGNDQRAAAIAEAALVVACGAG